MLEQRVSSSAAAVSDISCADQAQQASTNDRPPSSNRAALHKGRTSADAANVQQERGQLEEGGHFGHGCCPITGCQLTGSPHAPALPRSASLFESRTRNGARVSVENVENNHIHEEQDGAYVSDQELLFESELV